jgi:hypothetical protein
MATRKNTLAAEFCRCIKKVRKTIKLRPGVKKTSAAKEAAAIGVCVKAVLQTKGKTLKRFRCGKKVSLVTQKHTPLKGGALLGSPVIEMGAKPVFESRSPPADIPLAVSHTMKGGSSGAPYQSTDPTASRIQPGAGIQSYYENAAKAPLRL